MLGYASPVWSITIVNAASQKKSNAIYLAI